MNRDKSDKQSAVKTETVIFCLTVAFAFFTAGIFVGRNMAGAEFVVSTQYDAADFDPGAAESLATNVVGTRTSASTRSSEAESGTMPEKININSASIEELQRITGVGPATARKIIEYRERNGSFKNAADIMDVPGIGEKKYEELKDAITVN